VFEDGEVEWVTLPGPAAWWPQDYNYTEHGFDTPLTDNGYKAAFSMIFVTEEPANFKLINPVDHELQVLPNTIETQCFLRSFNLG
jgi:hypothetical protein